MPPRRQRTLKVPDLLQFLRHEDKNDIKGFEILAEAVYDEVKDGLDITNGPRCWAEQELKYPRADKEPPVPFTRQEWYSFKSAYQRRISNAAQANQRHPRICAIHQMFKETFPDAPESDFPPALDDYLKQREDVLPRKDRKPVYKHQQNFETLPTTHRVPNFNIIPSTAESWAAGPESSIPTRWAPSSLRDETSFNRPLDRAEGSAPGSHQGQVKHEPEELPSMSWGSMGQNPQQQAFATAVNAHFAHQGQLTNKEEKVKNEEGGPSLRNIPPFIRHSNPSNSAAPHHGQIKSEPGEYPSLGRRPLGDQYHQASRAKKADSIRFVQGKSHAEVLFRKFIRSGVNSHFGRFSAFTCGLGLFRNITSAVPNTKRSTFPAMGAAMISSSEKFPNISRQTLLHLLAEKEAHLAELMQQVNAAAPINRLPTETLSWILELAADLRRRSRDDDSFEVLKVASLVCHQWRESAQHLLAVFLHVDQWDLSSMKEAWDSGTKSAEKTQHLDLDNLKTEDVNSVLQQCRHVTTLHLDRVTLKDWSLFRMDCLSAILDELRARSLGFVSNQLASRSA
ncbi:hypothetical protein T439DRAFT_383592 [Meredithblackwellia eburnea MCA 4105]